MLSEREARARARGDTVTRSVHRGVSFAGQSLRSAIGRIGVPTARA